METITSKASAGERLNTERKKAGYKILRGVFVVMKDKLNVAGLNAVPSQNSTILS